MQLETFVITLFNKVASWEDFKETLRDFLIEMKQVSSTDQYYVQERQVSAN